MTGSRALAALQIAAEGSRRCELWEGATQVVIGEGPVPARLMLVGEQPGDREDRAGRPFVGPAGRVLDDGLEAAAQGVLGASMRVTRDRGRPLESTSPGPRFGCNVREPGRDTDLMRERVPWRRDDRYAHPPGPVVDASPALPRAGLTPVVRCPLR